MEHPRQRIALGDLNVDVENFRIGEVDNSRAAYREMIEEEGSNLVNLAEDILDHGVSPAELLIVGKDPENKGQYVVFEGNRRVTALKLLTAPALTAGTKVHSDFVRLGARFAKDPITHLECVEFPDKDSALLWIERKHTHLAGRGISPWGSPAKHRFEVYSKGVHRPSMVVINHLEAAELLPDSLRKRVLQRTTNLDRVFQMPYFKSRLGVHITDDGKIAFDNGDQHAGNALLLEMLQLLAEKEFNVDKIKTKESRKDFIDTFADRSVLAPPGSGDKKGATSKDKATRPAKKAQPKPSNASHRVTLAPRDKGTIFSIRDPRLSELYDEARGLDSNKFPAIGAVLVRVFLELSTDYYLKTLKIPRPKKHQNKSWSDQSISLKDKIKAALEATDPTGTKPELKLARQGLTDTGRMHAVQELHAFVHGLSAEVVGKEVRTIWDRWHNYLALLHQELRDGGH